MGSQTAALHYVHILNAAELVLADENTTREERHWADTAHELAKILLDQTGYARAKDVQCGEK